MDKFPKLEWKDLSGYGYSASVSKQTFGLVTNRAEATLIPFNGFYWVSITINKGGDSGVQQVDFNQNSLTLDQAKRWARQALKRVI